MPPLTEEKPKWTPGPFPIEKNIPLPATHSRERKGYPFGHMEIGDSFFVPCPDGDSRSRIQQRLSANSRVQQQRGKGKFTTRSVDGGVRVWRVE